MEYSRRTGPVARDWTHTTTRAVRPADGLLVVFVRRDEVLESVYVAEKSSDKVRRIPAAAAEAIYLELRAEVGE